MFFIDFREETREMNNFQFQFSTKKSFQFIKLNEWYSVVYGVRDIKSECNLVRGQFSYIFTKTYLGSVDDLCVKFVHDMIILLCKIWLKLFSF